MRAAQVLDLLGREQIRRSERRGRALDGGLLLVVGHCVGKIPSSMCHLHVRFLAERRNEFCIGPAPLRPRICEAPGCRRESGQAGLSEINLLCSTDNLSGIAHYLVGGVMVWAIALPVSVAPPLFAGLIFGRSIARGAAIGLMSEAAFLGFLVSIGLLYARAGEHTALVTSVVVTLACGAMAGALGYCCKRLAIQLRSASNLAWNFLFVIALAAFQGGYMAAWLYAMWRDVEQDQRAAFIADLIVPWGAVRGLMMCLGYV